VISARSFLIVLVPSILVSTIPLVIERVVQPFSIELGQLSVQITSCPSCRGYGDLQQTLNMRSLLVSLIIPLNLVTGF
jgi:hypothetical protein